MVKNPSAKKETQVQSLGREEPLEKEMVIHYSILDWGNPHGQRSLVGYSPWGCKRVKHALRTKQQQKAINS